MYEQQYSILANFVLMENQQSEHIKKAFLFKKPDFGHGPLTLLSLSLATMTVTAVTPGQRALWQGFL